MALNVLDNGGIVEFSRRAQRLERMPGTPVNSEPIRKPCIAVLAAGNAGVVESTLNMFSAVF